MSDGLVATVSPTTLSEPCRLLGQAGRKESNHIVFSCCQNRVLFMPSTWTPLVLFPAPLPGTFPTRLLCVDSLKDVHILQKTDSSLWTDRQGSDPNKEEGRLLHVSCFYTIHYWGGCEPALVGIPSTGPLLACLCSVLLWLETTRMGFASFWHSPCLKLCAHTWSNSCWACFCPTLKEIMLQRGGQSIGFLWCHVKEFGESCWQFSPHPGLLAEEGTYLNLFVMTFLTFCFGAADLCSLQWEHAPCFSHVASWRHLKPQCSSESGPEPWWNAAVVVAGLCVEEEEVKGSVLTFAAALWQCLRNLTLSLTFRLCEVVELLRSKNRNEHDWNGWAHWYLKYKFYVFNL